MKKTKPVYAKVPQFQEDTQPGARQDNDESPDEEDQQEGMIVAKSRLDRKGGKPETNRHGRNRTESEIVWEARRKKFETVMKFIGQKVEAGLWVAAAVLVIYYTNFVRDIA